MTRTSPSPVRNSPWRPALKWGLVALIVVPFAAALLLRMSLTLQVKTIEERIRERGEPLTFAELAASIPTVPNARNAAVAILDIWEEEEGPYWSEWRTTGRVNSRRHEVELDDALPILGRRGSTTLPWSAADASAARAFVESRREHDARMKEALARPECRYPVVVTDGFNSLLPHLSKLKGEVGAYHVGVLLALHEGQSDEAIAIIDQMARLTHTLNGEPFLISQLVHVACRAITMNCVKAVLEHASVDDDQLTDLRASLVRLEPEDAFRRAMIAERAGSVSVFDIKFERFEAIGFPNPGAGGLLGRVVFGAMRFSGVMAADKLLMLKTWETALQPEGELNHARAVEISEAMDEAVKEARSFPPKIFTSMLLPALGKAAQKFVKIETERQLLMHALTIERERLKRSGDASAAIAAAENERPQLPGLELHVNGTSTGYSLLAVADDKTTFSLAVNHLQAD